MTDDEIGQKLLQDGRVDAEQLDRARREAGSFGGRVYEHLIRLGVIGEREWAQWMAGQLGVPWVNLAGKRLDPGLAALLPATIAGRYRCVPLKQEKMGVVTTLYIATCDPSDVQALDDISFSTGLMVRPVVAGPLQLEAALEAFQRGDRSPLPDTEAEPAIGAGWKTTSKKASRAQADADLERIRWLTAIAAGLIQQGHATKGLWSAAIAALPDDD